MKKFKNVLAVVVAATMICACFAFTGCDNKSDDKDSKKAEDVEDEDEDEDEDDEEEEEEESEETEEETEATEAEEDIDDEEWEDLDEDDFDIETNTPEDFEDPALVAYAQDYMTDGYELMVYPAEYLDYDGAVEALLASRGEMSMSSSTSVDFDEGEAETEAEGYGTMDTAIVIKFDSIESAKAVFEEAVNEIDEEASAGEGEYTVEDNFAKYEETGYVESITLDEENLIVVVFASYDLDTMFAEYEG